MSDKYEIATPANWHKGDPCIIKPSLQDIEELQCLFPKGWTEQKPYLRYTPSPE